MKKSLIWILGFALAGLWACTKVKNEGSCGDGFLDPDEECEGLELRFGSCQDLGYYRQNGNLTCLDDCTIDRAPCAEFCGDGVIQELHETCDGTNLAELTCDGMELGNGQLACTTGCELDTSACDVQPSCGDGTVTVPLEQCEECDGQNFGDTTCENQGFAGGDLSCTGDCRVNTSGCEPYPETCGNGFWENGEACDGGDLNGASCIGLGFDGGQLACLEDCTDFDTSPCTNDGENCGNNVIDGGEVCDGNDLGGQSCSSRGFYGGTLACMWDCQSFDESYCVNP